MLLEHLPELPSLEEISQRAHVVALPMRVRFRGITMREALLIEGPAGWGEFSPFIEYDAPEAAWWLASGLEMAYVAPPAPRREKIEVNATIPAVEPSEVAEILAGYPGVKTVKVKVAEPGQNLAQDCARVAAVRDYDPHLKIRVDANGGWSPAQALAAAHALGQLGQLDYLEQPCATVAELQHLRSELAAQGITARIAADESIRRALDPYHVAKQQAADVAIVKAAPLGGVRRLLEIGSFMRQRGLAITVASALDTGVGMNAGIAAVAALPEPPAAAGLATQQLFVEDITPARPLIDGHLSTVMLAPEPERLAALAASGSRKDWWLDRLAQAWEVLKAGYVGHESAR
ncbi:o-succinylbenzoate synthase [Corynebacterium sp. sy039]|uniref:o-succinylbenzoate synthase n=1 Tax=Corynebacterium sp. sy039 TaxID=2599641 RepID=UPI0011B5199B|nr:o-succinylbenzoate synthase [Corynebacterium sp. sy039]QDZ43232.1 O-succinylbenzoate synthase [Corynebacterium sp. sy039]